MLVQQARILTALPMNGKSEDRYGRKKARCMGSGLFNSAVRF